MEEDSWPETPPSPETASSEFEADIGEVLQSEDRARMMMGEDMAAMEESRAALMMADDVMAATQAEDG
jgi:hypothetical protein